MISQNMYLIINPMLKLVAMFIFVVAGLDNGLGRTPAMGWNSWNRFHCGINEALIKETANQLVDLGLAAKGYRYLNLDDCWQIDRNATTKEIMEDKDKFPSGIAALSEYVHSKGLLFGLYSDAGTKTCQGRPGSYSFEDIDAATYAKWKVDYLKYDNCFSDGLPLRPRYMAMRDALNKTGRQIYYSMCEWGVDDPAIWAGPVGNSWRTTGDINGLYQSFIVILDKQVNLSKYAGPGGWNDPDMLEVGNLGMTHDQYQSHFSLWAALKAPLLIGCSLKGISKSTLEILGNEEVISVNQDPLGKQAELIYRETGLLVAKDIWGSMLSKNRCTLVFFNRGELEISMTISFSHPFFDKNKVIAIREIIDHQNVTVHSSETFTTKKIRRHAVAHYIFNFATGQEQTERES